MIIKILWGSFMKNKLGVLVSGYILASALSSCATMFSGTTQPVQLAATKTDGSPMLDAYCTLSNSRGSWSAMAPDTVTIRRDNEPISVKCIGSNGNYVGTGSFTPYYNTTNLWNIPLTIAFIIPGIAGWVTDGVSGTTNEYASTLNIKMLSVSNTESSVAKF